MQKPVWAKVVGIIGIVLASFGLLGGISTISTPKMMEMQKSMWSSNQDAMKESKSPEAVQQMKQTTAMMEKMWDVPDWFGTWCLISGIISLMIAGVYLFSCINLLLLKKSAIFLFYTAAGCSIVFSIIKAYAFMMSSPYLGMSGIFGGAFSIIFNVVLLIVVANGNKEAFE